MSLKTYIDTKIQAFRKVATQSVAFGLQTAPSNKILGIHDAYPSVLTDHPVSIDLVKIQLPGTFDSLNFRYNYREIERIPLPLSFIQYDAPTGQYLADTASKLSFNIDECIYFIEFSNGANVFRTEAFKVDNNFNVPRGVGYDRIEIDLKVY